MCSPTLPGSIHLPILSNLSPANHQELVVGEDVVPTSMVSSEGDVIPTLGDIVTMSYMSESAVPPPPPLSSLTTAVSTLESSLFNEPVMTVAVSVEGGGDLGETPAAPILQTTDTS